MTQISTVYDAIVSKISTNLSNYRQLYNPYVLDLNSDLFLEKGFGVSIGPGIKTDRYLGCKVTWERTFIITLTQNVTTTESNTSSKETLTKNFLEDHFTLLQTFEQDISLSQSAIGSTFSSDGGFEIIDFNGGPHFVLEIELLVEYEEDITS